MSTKGTESDRTTREGARVAVRPPGRLESEHHSPAIRAGGWVFVSGHDAGNGVTLAPEAATDEKSPYLQSARALQSRYVLEQLRVTLEAAGSKLARDGLRIYQWHASPYPTYEEFEAGNLWPRISISPYLRWWDEFMPDLVPASSSIGVRELPLRPGLIQIDLIALDGHFGGERIGFDAPEGAPGPLAGYKPAVRSGDWVFLAGTTPSDFKGDFGTSVHLGEMSGVAPDARHNPYLWYRTPIEVQTEYTLEVMAAVAEAAGTTLDRCVKAEVYIGHPNDFYEMDRVWQRWFPSDPPARVVVPYSALGIQGIRVEIAMILIAGDSDLKKEMIETSDAAEPVGHEPQGVRAGQFVFFSTQMPSDSRGRLADEVRPNRDYPYTQDVGNSHMQHTLGNVEAISEAAGTSLANVCRVQAFHNNLRSLSGAHKALAARFAEDPPALTDVAIGGPLTVPGAALVLDVIGFVPES